MAFSARVPALAAISLLASACIIVDSSGSGYDDEDFSWDDDGGSVGVGGEAGYGGSPGTGGSGGGDDFCVDETGTGETPDVCEDLAALSCDGQPSLAYASCLHGFEIYNPGPAEDFAACLQTIDAADACAVDPVADCVASTYDNACVSSFNADACAEWTDDCALHGEELDYGRCAFEMNLLRFETMVDMVECMNATDGLCQDRYDACFDAILTIE